MSDKPLPVAISSIIWDNKILLIQRIRGEFIGLLGLPGGKIEQPEHVSDAAIREIQEETGIQTEFKDYLGFVSEHLIENGLVREHFLLHICELVPHTTNITTNTEGKLSWFDLASIEQHKAEIIPSDYLMIEKIVKKKEKNYYNCVIEKQGDRYLLRRFE